VLEEYDRTGVVCPPNLKQGLFTTGNLDNIDHNPSSVTSKDDFHGTAISVTQHVFQDTPMTEHVNLPLQSTKDRKVNALPEKYKDIQPTIVKTKTSQTTIVYGCEPQPPMTTENNEQCLIQSQLQWLQHAASNIDKSIIGKNDCLSWSAYIAENLSLRPRPPAITALFPLFRDSALDKFQS